MVTAVATEKFFANNMMEGFIHMPADAATDQSVKAGTTTTTWRAMRDYEGFAVMATQGVLGGSGIEELSIYAATSSAGANATAIKITTGHLGNAIGDFVVLEVSAEDIEFVGQALGTPLNFTHVVAYIESHHNDDETSVTYIRFATSHATTGLTATTIS